MKKFTRTALATVFAGALVSTVAVGTAQAVSTDRYDHVRQWICSSTNATVDVSYVNAYGNYVTKSNTWLDGKRSQNGAVTCIYKDHTSGEYGDYISTSISDETGGYVSCAIFVNGRKVSESYDNSDYFSYASCY